jgi:predicted DNA-binding ribbon-helix-helix protein
MRPGHGVPPADKTRARSTLQCNAAYAVLSFSVDMGRGSDIHTSEAAELGRQRRRAPRRTGRRTQLTVPDDMWLELTEIARAAGTTPNDALVLLAGERLRDRRRAAALKRVADDRWRAFTDADGGAPAEGTQPLSEEQLVELSRAFREDD